MAEEAKAEGNAFFSKKQFPEAVSSYTRAIELDPRNHVYYSNRAAAYIGMSNWDAAIADGRKCVELNSGWGKGYFRLGSALMGAGKNAEAVGIFTQGLNVDGDNQELKDKLAAATAIVRQEEERKMSEPSLTAAAAKEKGNVFFKLGKIEEAIAAYTEALQLAEMDDPNKAIYLVNRAQCYTQLRLYDEVVADCDKCLAIDPDNFKAFIRRGMAYQAMEKYAKALDDFKNAQRIDPSSTVVTQNIAEVTKVMRSLM